MCRVPGWLVVREILGEAEIEQAKSILINVVAMLVGLIKAVAPDRLYEEWGEAQAP